MMKILLHACCAPCTAGALQLLNEEDIYPVLYWNNPNIHPFTEYKSRLGALTAFAQQEGVPLVVDGQYGLRSFIQMTAAQPDVRCAVCYGMRFHETAKYAKENGYDAFSTTLSISPYQNQDLIRRAGEEAASEFGLLFRFWDFRPKYRAGQEKIRALGLYMQKYCGCIYSEEERYAKQRQKLRTGFFSNFRAEGNAETQQ